MDALAADGAAKDATFRRAPDAVSALPGAVITAVQVNLCRRKAVGRSASFRRGLGKQ